MPIYKGDRDNPTAIYFGDSSLGKVYHGDNLVWQKTTVSEPFIFKVNVGNESITLPLAFGPGYTYNFIVDWGDGSPVGTVTSYDDADATHTYSAGTYNISISGICQVFVALINDILDNIIEIVQWGNCDFRVLEFQLCTNLTKIPNSPITGISNAENLNSLFADTGLTGPIPVDLFKYATAVSDFGFGYTFSNCTSLTGEIPTDLFKYNILCNSWYGCFLNCNLLSGNAPDLWNDYPSADGTSCFSGCTGLDNYDDIPVDWK